MSKIILSDKQIIDGLIKLDPQITKTYFYDYCRIAYLHFDKIYHLQNNDDTEFFSLAHELYLKLYKDNWKSLRKKNKNIKLRTWIFGGFKFIVLNRLRSHKEFKDIEDQQIIFEDKTVNQRVHNMIEEICSLPEMDDYYSQEILRLMFIDGFTGKEIGAQMGISASAVSQRFHKMLKNIIKPYFHELFESDSSFDILTNINKEISISKEKDINKERDMNNERDKNFDNANRITPEFVTQLESDEIFVFGSNLQGMHGGGAARIAYEKFGAQMGCGVGLTGSSYAIPTMQGGVETIKPYVDEFIEFASQHPEKKFLVTRIGCGIAGFDDADIAPLFNEATNMENIYLPKSFRKIC